MLLQSHLGEIHLLPALPPSWKAGQITGLCARGGDIADIAWEKGQLKEAILAIRSDCNQSSQNIESTEICIRCKSEIHHIEENNLLNDTELPWELTEFSRPRA